MTPVRGEAIRASESLDALIDRAERLNGSIRADLKQSFRIKKRQFGYVKACYRGLASNILQVAMRAYSGSWRALPRHLSRYIE